jgi:hypothetical protein
MRPPGECHASYMQICACMNAAAAGRHAVDRNSSESDSPTPRSEGTAASDRQPVAPLTREPPLEPESLSDIHDEKDPEGYGFGV